MAPPLFPWSGQLEELLIRELALIQSASVLELQKRIAKRTRRYSLPGMYKALNKLRDDGVVYKEGDRFGLSLYWVLNFSHLAESLLETHVRKATHETLLPEEGEKITWRFSRLLPYDDFWIHILLVMLNGSPGSILYQWIPHPWFHLFQSDKGHSLVDALKAARYQMYNIIGGATYLDRRAAEITSPGVYEYAYPEGPFEGQMDRYYSVVENYVLTHKIDPRTVRNIENLFREATSKKELKLPQVMGLVQQPVKITLVLEHNKQKSKRLLRKFADYFGHC